MDGMFCLPDFALVVDGTASGSLLGAPAVVQSEAVQDSRLPYCSGAGEPWDALGVYSPPPHVPVQVGVLSQVVLPPTTETAATSPRNGTAAFVAPPAARSPAAAVDGASGVAELELELIQSHMAQKPVLRGEVGCAYVAREVSVERGGMGERGCARRLDGWVWV